MVLLSVQTSDSKIITSLVSFSDHVCDLLGKRITKDKVTIHCLRKLMRLHCHDDSGIAQWIEYYGIAQWIEYYGIVGYLSRWSTMG